MAVIRHETDVAICCGRLAALHDAIIHDATISAEADDRDARLRDVFGDVKCAFAKFRAAV